MNAPDTAKGHTEISGAALSKISECLGNTVVTETPTVRQLQARRLSRIYALSDETAVTIAALAFSGGPR